MGSGLCTPKNVIMVEYDESNRVKNFTIHGCYYHAPLEFQFTHPSDTSKEKKRTTSKDYTKKCTKKDVTKVVPVRTTGA